MSRCFSFPPPGYELKARPDDVNLLIKDKHKHKKHKHKKEKDKKEGSERKEKERGESKHKEDKKRKRKEDNKKERKEDDKKEKEDKIKDKQSSLGVFLENQNGRQKLVPDVRENGNVLAINDKNDHNRMVNGQSLNFWELEKVDRKDGKEINGYRNIVGEEDGSKNKHQIKITKVGDKKTTINDKNDHNRMVNGQSLNFRELEKVDKKEGKEINGYRNIVGEEDRSKGEHQIKITKVEDKKTKEEKDRIKKEEKRKRKEEKKKRKELKRKENNEYSGKLPKLKEFNDSLDAKDSGVRPSNMSRPATVSHNAGHIEGGFRLSQNTINASAMDQKVNPKLSSPQSVIDGVRNIVPCHTANIRKPENGRVTVNNHVVSNGVISPHIVRIERKMEPFQTGNGVAMIKQIVNDSANVKVPALHPFGEKEDAFYKITHNNEARLNDSSESRKPSSSSACLKGKEKVSTTTKPPHPDLKYLSQILSVPDVIKLPESDNQEWLFEPQSKRPRSASSEIQSSTKEVWSEAVKLESADITALPYVIPY